VAYEQMLDISVDTPPTRRYVVALFNSGQRQKAHAVAKILRDIYGVLPVVSEVEAQVAETIGDLDTAHEIYVELDRIEPSNPRHLLKSSLVDARRGRLSEAAHSLEDILVRFEHDPQALMSIAQVMAWADQPPNRILEAAYRARRLAHDDPEIQLAYVMLFFSMEHKAAALSAEVVGVGTSVRLESEREKGRWITILDEVISVLDRNEAGPDDPLARKLLGLGVGDHVVLRKDAFDETEYRVAEIQNKYVRALQEVLEDFPLRFPDHQGLHRVHVEGDDITPMLSVSEEHFQRVEFVQRAYDNREIPLGVFARLIGRSSSEVWIGRVQQESGIHAAAGSHGEQVTHQQLLSDTDDVAVDLTCLLTLRLLDRLDLLKKRFTHIFVAQALKDQLFEDIRRQKQFSRKYGVLLRHEGRYIFQEIPSEIAERQTRFLEDVYAFVNEACTVVPLPELLTLSHTTSEQIEESIGLEPLASVFVAKEKNIVLYCDDAILRRMAFQMYGVKGVWTRAVIQDSFDRGLLAPEQYHEAIAGLVWANYHFVQLSIDTLKHVLQANQWVVTRSTTKVFQQLSGPVTTEQSAVQVLAMLIKDVWLEPIPYSQKTAILDMCLSVLTTDRVAIRVLSLFERAIMKLFEVMSFQQDQVLAEMKRWSKAQALTRQAPALLGH
jgi:transcription elongation GreA/GreB family factor/predicted nucleic acid-binding protein